MTVLTPSRPDLAAHREATATAFPKLVGELTRIIGRKLTAYIAGVKDVRALDRWIEGAEPYKNAEERLRFAFRVVRTLENHDRPSVVQAWLIGLNPELNDRVPIRLLREGDLEKVGPEILGAVRAFVAGGQAISLTADVEGLIYRLARGPDPWQPLDWALAGPDGTFGNRFDDPEGAYRVLYASSQRLGCYLETLARFRVDPTLPVELAEIAGENDFTPFGHVPPEWAETRMLGSATQYGSYADIYGGEWIAILRRDLAADCPQLGIAELNAGVLQQSGFREITQRASRLVYNRAFDGIRYRSRYGHNVCNWALFEPFKLNPKGVARLDLGDPDLQEALAIHRLQLGR